MSSAIRPWLEELGLARYADRFEADDIDLEVLPSLSEQDLEKLGVSMGHRKKLLKAVAALGGGAASSMPSASATPAIPPAARSRPGAGAEARKIVTILFADLAGSTALHERLDPESVRSFMEDYYRSMRGAIEAHGGTLVKFLGDGVMAAFGVPHVTEDDASRAVHAGSAMQQAFGVLARTQAGIGLRVAINTGEVVVSADNTDVVGDPVNVAARLQQEAGDGDVVVGESTRRLVASRVTLEPLGTFALKGRSEPVKAWRVVSLERPTGTTAAAFVGRDEELARLTAVYDAATAAPAARLAVLLGSPGLGKSRLIEEVAGRLGDTASVVTAHCDAAGGATFAPVAAALREFFGIEAGAGTPAVQAAIEAALPAAEPERGRIAGGVAAVLAGSPASPEETFFVIRRLLAALAAARPVVLVIDDLHWAEPLLLDLVEHLVQWGSGVRLLVLVGARPELRDLRSSLVTPGGLVSDVVTLGGLDAGAAMRLAANVIGAADLPAAVAAKVLATTEGNPLFVGELVRMLVDEGALERQGERWIVGANLAALEMPPTIHALLAARIERLGPEDRTVLERAAVVGRHFSRSAVAALLGRNGNELNARLEALRRTELIERDTGWFLGEPMLRFHHVLIRDAAYRRLLKGTRAELHERLANWVEAQVEDAPEHDETIGWHLEQAHQHRRELGPLDAQGRTLGERAARRLAAAGRRALARDDLPVAADLLGRAIDRLDPDDPARADLALDWCEALLAAGDVAAAAKAIEELGRFAEDRGLWGYGVTGLGGTSDSSPTPNPLTPNPLRLRAWHTCFTGQLTVLTAPQELHATADAVAAAAEELAALGDAAGEAKGHFVHALALARLGKIGGCEAALDKALAAARRADDRRRANTVLAIAPLAALWGPSPVTRASGRCLDVVRVLRITQGAPAVEAVALSCQAVLEALRGRTDAAHRMLASSRKMVEDLGITHRLLEVDAFGGLIDLLEGDAAAAERNLRRAYDGLRDLGLGIDAARAAALLARALLVQDRGAEAEALSHESEALAGDDLKAAIAWRGVRAEALARRGEPTVAVELANRAVEIAAATDALLDHADARLALAAALRAAGRGGDARAEERRAIELWEAKGATLLVERTRRAEAPVAAATGAPPPAVAPRPRRRIVANRASEALVAFNAAMAAPDFAAFRAQLSESYAEIDHPTGVSYGRDANVASLERLMRSHLASCQLEPLATLGDALVLSRRRVSASATRGGRFDVGAYEQEAYTVAELDDRGRWCRHEVFGADHLHDARVRLYERYAELLPDGPERARATAAARSLDVFRRAETDPDILVAVLAPDFEGVDHRHLSSHSLRGAAAYIEHLRAWRQVADDLVFRECDVLALAPHAALVATLHTGTARSGGGAYERPFLTLLVLDANGGLARAEWFDADREAEALARFDEIVAAAAPQRTVRRRVTPNPATRNVERFGAAVAARDLDALADLLCDDIQTVHHGTGLTYGRKGFLTTWRSMFRAERMTRWQEILASLGDSLVLGRHTVQLEGFAEAHLAAVGPVEVSEVNIFEVDERARARRIDLFPPEKLGAAVARLYQRHAELLPEGPERARAAATAASFAVFQDADYDPEQVVCALAPDFESVDHRHLSSWSLRGADAYLAHLRALHEVADGVEFRQLDLLAAGPKAHLARVLHTGTDRAGGGAYERPFLRLFVANDDGCIARAEWFDDDREAEALARFDELVAGAAPQPTARRHPVPNAATRSAALFDAAFASPDPTALEMHFRGSAATVVDHPTESTYGAEGAVDSYRRLQRMENPVVRHEPMATLGDALGLFRRRISAAGSGGRFDVGAFEREEFVVIEQDVAIEIFAAGRLGDAVVRLYERWAAELPEGPARSRAAAVARAALAALGPIDLDRMAEAFAPDLRLVDHRVLSTWSAESCAEVVNHFRLHLGLAPDFAPRIDDILALDGNAMVACVTFVGTARESGGSFENRTCNLYRFGDDGRLARVDCYEAELAAEALARFAELAPASAASDHFTNAATATVRTLIDSVVAHAWTRYTQLLADDFRMFDRRRVVQLEMDRARLIAFAREIADGRAIRARAELVATRGERLALTRLTFEFEGGDVGPSEVAFLLLTEVNDQGRIVTGVRWDPEDLDAARGELDARFEAGEATAQQPSWDVMRGFVRAIARRDFAAVAALCAESMVEYDHRSLAVLGTTRGAEAWAQNFTVLAELSADTAYRADHFRAGARGFHSHGAWHGTRAGGPYEIPLNAVIELDERGRIVRADIYDDDGIEAALARFAELARGTGAPARFANAVTRMADRFVRATAARDWQGLADLFAPNLRFDDRRPLLRMELSRAGFLDQFRTLFDVPNARWTATVLATRGERLALFRLILRGDVGDDGGPLEIDHLWVGGVGDDARCETIVLFEPGELAAAWAELDALYDVQQATLHPRATAVAVAQRRAYFDRDWDAFAATHAPDLVCHDHRLLGWGTLQGVAAWVRTQQVLVELAPDTGARMNHVTISEHGALRSVVISGTRDGGAFELALLRVDEIDAAGRTCRIDLFDADDLDDAHARFAEIAAAGAMRLPSLAKPTAATLAMECLYRSFDAQDWDTVRAACAKGFTWEDRRPIVGLCGDVELMIASACERMASGARHERREIIGTAGERLAISRILWAGGPANGRFEVEFLAVHEIDRDGLCSALIFFDPADLRAAQREAWARWAAIDPTTAEVTANLDAVLDAWNAKDLDRLRALFAEDLVAEDHRLTGVGRSEGREAYLRSVAALWELAPESHLEAGMVWLADAPHAKVYLCRRAGVLPDGGEFATDFLVLVVVEGGVTTRLEVFEVDAADAALARFEELRPDPLRVPPNAATRTWDRWCAAAAAGDWDAIAALYHPSYRWDDRRRLIRVATDFAGTLENDRFVAEVGWRPVRTLLATAGDRLALQHVLWRTGEGGSDSEVETLQLSEVDGEGRFVSSATFDPEDRDAAFFELGRRYLGIHRPSALPRHEALRRAGRDLARLRAALPDGFVFHDHRRTGLGRIEGADAYVASVAALRELAPDAMVGQSLYYLADEPHGTLSIGHSFGTLSEGGAFESCYAMILLFGPDGIVGGELFELDHLEAAKARFAELRARAT